jgi:hypothetical protein
MTDPIAVMSHWSMGYNGHLDRANKNSIHFAFLLAQKHYGQVHLITDKRGLDDLAFLPWASTSTSLEGLDPRHRKIWSFGKIHAMREAAQRFGHFIHIDNDCFLWKKPPQIITSQGFFAMCRETMGEDVMALSPSILFAKHLPKIDTAADWMPNMALCGGLDSEGWIDYTNTAIEIAEDKSFEAFWQGNNGPSYARACLAEQWMLAAFLQRRMKSIFFFFNSPNADGSNLCAVTDDQAIAMGISHLAHNKRNEDLIARIAQRLSKNPPDLAMRANVTLPEMMRNLGQAAILYANDGFKNCTREQHNQRLEICKACEFWDASGYMGLGKCRKCGCSGMKLWVASSKCPIGKWKELT